MDNANALQTALAFADQHGLAVAALLAGLFVGITLVRTVLRQARRIAILGVLLAAPASSSGLGALLSQYATARPR